MLSPNIYNPSLSVAQGKPVVGRHVFGELYEVDRKVLEDEQYLRYVVIEAARAARAHLVSINSWRFVGGDKGGISVIGLVLESHIAIHTWPEYRYATVDVYTCGDHTDPISAFYKVIEMLRPARYTINYADRSYSEAAAESPTPPIYIQSPSSEQPRPQ